MPCRAAPSALSLPDHLHMSFPPNHRQTVDERFKGLMSLLEREVAP
jgi:hypothetical protein